MDNARAVAGFACYGALSLLVIAICWLIAIPLRGERRKVACQKVVHRALALWETIMETMGCLSRRLPGSGNSSQHERNDHRPFTPKSD